MNTWTTVSFAGLLGLMAAGTVTLMAQEPATQPDKQTQAMAQLIAPAPPTTIALAEQTDAQQPESLAPGNLASCVTELDAYVQPLAVTFDQGSTQLTADNQPLLSHIAGLIAGCDDALVQVAGHADGSGDDRTNLTLSWDRADQTLAALVQLGVDPAALEAVGYGARAPLAQGSGDDEAAANRRVDFRVLRRRD